MHLRSAGQFGRQFFQTATSGLALAAVTFVAYKLHLSQTIVVLLYLLVVVWQSLAGGFALSALFSLAAALCLDFFFLPPIFSLRISDPLNILVFVVFLAISLVLTHLVSRVQTEADRAQRRGNSLEQLHEVARKLLLVEPDRMDEASLVTTFRDGFAATAVCLFDGSKAEWWVGGATLCDLPERTKQAYFVGEDADAAAVGVAIRCLRRGNTITGAIGFENLPEQEWIAGPLSVLAGAALEHARALRKSGRDAAAAQTEIFRTAVLDALAHEFKTPLATILAVIGSMRESRRLGTEDGAMARLIESQASRLCSLTERLLRLARLDREEVKTRLRSSDITALVQRVANRYSAQFTEHRISITCPIGSVDAPADRELLDLALTQLLDNAFKYSKPESPIAIEIDLENDSVSIKVRNEGSPIAPLERDRIFERFYRGADVRNTVSGAGLGLHVARKIAAAHGGTLDLDSSTSSGTVVFCLKLPTAAVGISHVPIYS